MPIYGFECGSCGHSFDRLQKLSDPDPTQCPACSAKGLRRQVSAPTFRLAGSGWYETDFKKDRDKRRNLVEASESKTGAKAEPKAESSSETKSSAKPEEKKAVAPSTSAPA